MDDESTLNENGLTFSQRQFGGGLGSYCFRKATHVYRKVKRQSQKYRAWLDDGSVSQMLHDIFELVCVETEAGGVGRDWIKVETDCLVVVRCVVLCCAVSSCCVLYCIMVSCVALRCVVCLVYSNCSPNNPNPNPNL